LPLFLFNPRDSSAALLKAAAAAVTLRSPPSDALHEARRLSVEGRGNNNCGDDGVVEAAEESPVEQPVPPPTFDVAAGDGLTECLRFCCW
jgi:hypothetical protein